MECSICWENLENKVCSLTCGHIFHRSCIEPLIYDTEYLSCPICRKRQKALFGSRTIREAFFTSPTRPSAPSSDVEIQDALDKAITENVIISHSLVRTRAQSARIRTQHLRAVQQRVAGAERESILQREVEKMKRARDSALEALADLRAQRDAWAEHARMAEETKDELQSAVARLEEMEREKDNIVSALRIRTRTPTPRPPTPRAPTPHPAEIRRPRRDAACSDAISGTAMAQPPLPIQGTKVIRNNCATSTAITTSTSASISTSARRVQQQLTVELMTCISGGKHSWSGRGSNQYMRKRICIKCGLDGSESILGKGSAGVTINSAKYRIPLHGLANYILSISFLAFQRHFVVLEG